MDFVLHIAFVVVVLFSYFKVHLRIQSSLQLVCFSSFWKNALLSKIKILQLKFCKKKTKKKKKKKKKKRLMEITRAITVSIFFFVISNFEAQSKFFPADCPQNIDQRWGS